MRDFIASTPVKLESGAVACSRELFYVLGGLGEKKQVEEEITRLLI